MNFSVKNSAFHYDIRWQQAPCLKKTGPRACTTQAASIKSVSLRRIVGGVARGPVWCEVRLEAISPTG